MAISQLASPDAPLSGGMAAEARRGSRAQTTLPVAVGVALLATVLYAAFAHGSVTRGTATRVELVVTAVAVVAAIGWLWLGSIRLTAAKATVAGVLLLVAFACWSGLSVVWSVNPDQTWIEVNRIVTYTLVVVLGVALAASYARAVELIGQGFLLAVLAVTLYALGQKVVPGLHVAGVFDLNRTGPVPRLQDPLGYWNALALFIAMGSAIALAGATDDSRSGAVRLGAACALSLTLITVPLTYSRGGLIALVVALAASVSLGRTRLRSSVWLLVVVLVSLPAILLGLLMPELSAANVPLGTREWAGGVLAVPVLGGLTVLVLAGRRLLAAEPRLQLTAAGAARLRRLIVAGAGVVVVGALVGLALSHRGLTGTISHLWHGFTNPHSTNNYNPRRLLTADSYRWVWWKEAAAAFGARPWQGWGAGSFPVLHLLYRHNTLPVQQPHSVPLQFLAETGVIGGVLGIGAFVLLVVAGVRAVRSQTAGRQRRLAAGMLAAALAYGVHCLYDWDWNIPALSLPVFLFLGVLGGRATGAGRRPGHGQAGPLRTRVAPSGSAPRALALAGATLWLCLFALSVELPQLAADRASTALVDASSPSAAAVRTAESDASLAAQLDPLSDSGLKAEATIAQRRSRPLAARRYFQEAVARNPSDAQAWQFLALFDGVLGDRAGGFAAAQKAIDLDPMGGYAQSVVAAWLHETPPSSSATRFRTPPPGR